MKNTNLILGTVVACCILFGCNKDEANNQQKANLRLEITDAPIDRADVRAAVVTVVDVKLDGKSVEGFQTTTVDLYALTNGRSMILADAEVDAKTYSRLELILDCDENDKGDSPGCYVEDDQGTKHPLGSGMVMLTADADAAVMANQDHNWVVDVDLRKCIVGTGEGINPYRFSSQATLNAGVRVVEKEKTGRVTGTCSDLVTQSDVIVVFAYKAGAFQEEEEWGIPGPGEAMFPNAVTSGKVDGSGSFSLHFLEAGDYELHFAGYNESAANGELTLKGMLDFELAGGSVPALYTVSAMGNLNLTILITGILPL